MGELKDQKKAPVDKRLDLKGMLYSAPLTFTHNTGKNSYVEHLTIIGSNFKNLRGLDINIVNELLTDVASKKLNLQQMNAESAKTKKLQDIQAAFVKETRVSSWSEATDMFPMHTTSEALDEFTTCKFTTKSTPQRYTTYFHGIYFSVLIKKLWLTTS